MCVGRRACPGGVDRTPRSGVRLRARGARGRMREEPRGWGYLSPRPARSRGSGQRRAWRSSATSTRRPGWRRLGGAAGAPGGGRCGKRVDGAGHRRARVCRGVHGSRPAAGPPSSASARRSGERSTRLRVRRGAPTLTWSAPWAAGSRGRACAVVARRLTSPRRHFSDGGTMPVGGKDDKAAPETVNRALWRLSEEGPCRGRKASGALVFEVGPAKGGFSGRGSAEGRRYERTRPVRNLARPRCRTRFGPSLAVGVRPYRLSDTLLACVLSASAAEVAADGSRKQNACHGLLPRRPPRLQKLALRPSSSPT